MATFAMAGILFTGSPLSFADDGSTPWRSRLYKNFPMTKSVKGGAPVDKKAPTSISVPKSGSQALTKANELKRAGDYPVAITFLTSAINAFPTNPDIYIELGNCLIHERRLNDALLNVNAAMTRCTPTVAMYRQRANAYYMLHDYQNALKDLEQVGRMAKPTADDYFIKANCYSNSGNSKAVIENLGFCLKLDPKNAEAYYLRAKTYKNLNQSGLAEADFAKAMSIQK